MQFNASFNPEPLKHPKREPMSTSPPHLSINVPSGRHGSLPFIGVWGGALFGEGFGDCRDTSAYVEVGVDRGRGQGLGIRV